MPSQQQSTENIEHNYRSSYDLLALAQPVESQPLRPPLRCYEMTSLTIILHSQISLVRLSAQKLFFQI